MTIKSTFAGLCMALIICCTASAQFTPFGLNNGWFTGSGAAIPPTGSGGGACSPSNTTTVSVVSNMQGFVTTDLAIPVSMGVYMNIQHSYAADLLITLTHCGVSVVLCDGATLSAGGGTASNFHDFNGSYSFRDDAATAFADANSSNSVEIDVGDYRPTSSLDAFRGLPAGGLWELTICDRAAGDVGTLNSVGSFIHRQGGIATVNLNQVIPPVGTGGGTNPCTNPDSSFDIEFSITGGGRVAEVGVDLTLTHSYAADLLITLSHNGVTRTIIDGASSGLSGNNFLGTYAFRNGFTPRSSATVTAGNVDSGFTGFGTSMLPFQGMEAAGDWKMTICDRAGGDVGALTSYSLYLVQSSVRTVITQSGGPGSDATVSVLGGTAPGNQYFKPFSVTQGNFPNGWFYGIDIPILDLVAWYNAYPFFPSVWGTFGNCVEDAWVFPAPLPSNLPLYYVALEFAPSGNVIQRSDPETYTLQ